MSTQNKLFTCERGDLHTSLNCQLWGTWTAEVNIKAHWMSAWHYVKLHCAPWFLAGLSEGRHTTHAVSNASLLLCMWLWLLRSQEHRCWCQPSRSTAGVWIQLEVWKNSLPGTEPEAFSDTEHLSRLSGAQASHRPSLLILILMFLCVCACFVRTCILFLCIC